MSNASPLYQLVEDRLGEEVQAFISERRPERKSWRDLAQEITERTGVTVTHETVRQWASSNADDTAGAA